MKTDYPMDEMQKSKFNDIIRKLVKGGGFTVLTVVKYNIQYTHMYLYVYVFIYNVKLSIKTTTGIIYRIN